MTTACPALRIRLWRDYHEQAITLPDMDLGEQVVTADPVAAAAQAHALGARRVDLTEAVDLHDPADPAATVRALGLVRELTSYAIVVGWRLRLGSAPGDWRILSHLHPPTVLAGGPAELSPDVLSQWRAQHFLGKLVHRHGPGFVQVRDRRDGRLRRLTIDDPDYLAAIGPLLRGTAAADIPAPVLGAFRGAGVAALVGDQAWWLPYRARRWPFGAIP